MYKYQITSTTGAITVLVLFALGIAGWISNIFQIVSEASGPIATWGIMIFLKIIGIFVFPIGSILGIAGWF